MQRFSIEFETDGNDDTINLNPELTKRIAGIKGDGLLHVFVVGSTAAITTLEFEPGLVKSDLPQLFQRLIPHDIKYDHEATWNDDNGHSHLRAMMVGPDLIIPFSNGRLQTGEWQQIVLIDFDTRPRRRTVIGTVIV
jgi:secondary thiamine-phosphate synthase enzyme